MRVLIPLALAALALAACGKPAPTTAPGARISGPGGQVTVTGSNGQVATIKAGPGAAAAGRAGPSYAPVYPGAAVLSRIDTSVPNGDVTVLQFTTKDSPEQVLAFYKVAVGKAGLPVSADLDMGGSRMLAAEEEGGARGMQLTVAAANGLTTVQLTYHLPKG